MSHINHVQGGRANPARSARNAARGVTIAALALATAPTLARQTYEYTGTPGGSWYTQTNWNPNGVPGVSPGGVAVLVQQARVELGPGQHATILSLSAPAGVTVKNGMTIALNAAITDMQMFGTDTLSGFKCFGTLNLAGNNVRWVGGILDSPDVILAGTLTMGGAGGTGPNPQFAGAFHNQGAVSGGFDLRTGALVENANDWALGSMAHVAGHTGGLFRNAGDATRGPGQADFTVSFENQGNISIDTGTLRLLGPATTLDGVVFLANNAQLKLYQSTAPGAPPTSLGFTASGQGDIVLDSGNHTVHAATSSHLSTNSPNGLWINTGGTVRLEANLTNGGKTTFAGGRLQSEGGGFVNTTEGVLIWGTPGSTGAVLAGVLDNSGWIGMRGAPRLESGIVVNQPGALMDVSSGAFSQAPGTLNVVENFGTVRKTAATGGSIQFGAPLATPGGRVEVERGVLSLNAGSEFLGTSVIQIGPNPDARLLIEGIGHGVTGGHLRVQGTAGMFDLNGGAVLNITGGRVTNELASPAEFRVLGTLNCQVSDAFDNQGRFRLDSGTLNGGTPAGAGFRNHGTMFITGTILGLVANQATAQAAAGVNIGSAAGQSGMFINASGATLEVASGAIVMLRANSSLSNGGVIIKNSPGSGTISGPGLLVNSGTVNVLQGTLGISSEVAEIVNGRLTGGTWIVSPGATLTLPLGFGAIQGPASVTGGPQGIPALGGVTEIDGGDLFLRGLFFQSAPGGFDVHGGGRLSIEGSSEMTVPGGTTNGEPESILDEIRMVPVILLQPGPGPRLITPTLQNHARLVPGGHDAPGPFNLTGNLQMFPTGRVIVELAGPEPVEEYDQVAITGGATLAGTLDARLIGSFTPVLGQTFTVLTTSAPITGTFTTIIQPPNMPAGLALAPVYTSNALTLVVQDTCYPDCNQSGSLTVADFGCFQTRFVTADPYADCNGDGQRTVADFGCFQTRFVVGCP